MELLKRDNKVTIVLGVMNIVVFIYLSFQGMTENASFLLSKGAVYAPYVVEQGEYYRLVTSMFLHFGIEHLGNNMLLLFIIGSQLERELGAVKFSVLYFASGLGGGALSLYESIQTMDNAVSAGASGAIFGVIGGMLWVVIRNRGRLGGMTSQGLGIMIALSLYFGFTSTGVDNHAHIGGLIVGGVLAIILYRVRKTNPY